MTTPNVPATTTTKTPMNSDVRAPYSSRDNTS